LTVLGIETSCDETSAAVVADGKVLSNIISSQLVHAKFGGVVPELASRAHMRMIIDVVDEALAKAGVSKEKLDGIAVTQGPGLVGSLLVGLSFAKALAYGLGIPFIGVNHMEGHLYSTFLEDPQPEYPFIALIVSGGHSMLVHVKQPFDQQLLGQTRDDAAGEAFDKVAKMLGLGYPGGPAIDKLAREGNPKAIDFPRSFLEEDSFDFSFSGIKTSVLYYLRKNNLLPLGNSKPTEKAMADICASFQASVVEVLVTKTVAAAEQYGVKTICLAGGVSANSLLRTEMKRESDRLGIALHFPRLEYCMDNGAMIALVGEMKLASGISSPFDLKAVANLPMEAEG